MKKFILVLSFSLMILSLKSQVLINETFDGTSVPADWETLVQSGSLDWDFGDNVIGDPNINPNDDFSSNAAIFNDYKYIGSAENKVWLRYNKILDLSSYNDGNYYLILDFDYSCYDNKTDDVFYLLKHRYQTWIQIKNLIGVTNTVVHQTVYFSNDFVYNFKIGFLFDDIDGSRSHSVGVDNVVLKITPKNDTITSAFEINSFPYSQHLDASGATNNDGCIDFGNGNGTNDGVWYKITGDGANYKIDVTGNAWNPELSIFSGTTDNLVYLKSIYTTGTVSQSFSSVKGTVYYINVANNNESSDGPEGVFDIEVTKSCDQLVINSQSPSNLYGCENSDIAITVDASGSGLNYTWKKNGIIMMYAPNSPTYQLSNLTQNYEGNYTYSIKDACGNIVSNVFSPTAVNVDAPPAIITNPQSICAITGDVDTLKVVATGENLTYAWLLNTNTVPMQESSSLIFSNIAPSNQGEYQAKVSNLGCGSVFSDIAVVNVYDAPLEISQQPESQSLNSGDNVTFTVEVNLTNVTLEYKWFKDGTEILNNNSNQLSLTNITSSDVGDYSVEVSSSCESVTSDIANLTVDGVSGINSFDTGKLKIYPNPVQNFVNISNDFVINEISIFDVNGKLIISKNIYKTSDNIDLSFLQSGVYSLRVVTKNTSKMINFVKK